MTPPLYLEDKLYSYETDNGHIVSVGDMWNYRGSTDGLPLERKGFFLVLGFAWGIVDEDDYCGYVVVGYHLKSRKIFHYPFKRQMGWYEKLVSCDD